MYALILSVDRAIALSTLARRPVKTSLQAAVSADFAVLNGRGTICFQTEMGR